MKLLIAATGSGALTPSFLEAVGVDSPTSEAAYAGSGAKPTLLGCDLAVTITNLGDRWTAAATEEIAAEWYDRIQEWAIASPPPKGYKRTWSLIICPAATPDGNAIRLWGLV